MYTVSDACRAALRARARTDRLTGVLTLTDGTVLPFGAADLMSGSVTIDNQCVNGQELEFGCVYMGQAAFQLRTGLSRCRLYGARVTLTYELLLAEGWYAIPLGVYTVAEAERGSVSVRVKAYDNMLALCGTYPGTVLLGTPYEMLCQIAEACGLAVGCTAEELAGFPNGEELFQLDATDGCESWRDCLSALAQAVGGFGTVDRSGALVLRRFAPSPGLSLTAAERSELTLSDFRCHYCGVTGGGQGAYREEDSGLVLALTHAPLLEKGLEERRQALLEALLPGLAAGDYTPAALRLPGDPTLEPGDRIALPDRDAETLVTHLVWKFRGAATVKGVGKNPHLSGGTSQDQRTLHQLQAQTDSQRTVYYQYTNPRAETAADGVETVLGTIQFAPTQQTSALFLAQLLLDVTAEQDSPAAVTVRYYLNGSRMDYQPRQRVPADGPCLLGLVYPLSGLSGGTLYSWSVRIVAEHCTATVDKGALLATITGQNMAALAPWDGTIEEEELLAPVPLGRAGLAPAPLGAELTCTVQAPQTAALADRLAALPLGGARLTPGALYAAPAVQQVIRDWSFTTRSDATYATDWVSVENGVFALRRQFTVWSEVQPVDSGLCTALYLPTDQYKTVEQIEVT